MRETNIRYTLDASGSSVVVRRTSTVSAQDVNVNIVGDRIFIEPKPETDLEKYRTEPEGDMLRVYAVRDIKRHGVDAGARGGLIAAPACLSQKGDCWIEEGVTVGRAALVTGDAYLYGSVILDDTVRVEGRSYVSNSELRAVGGSITVTDNAQVGHCTVNGPARLSGDASIVKCTIAPISLQAVHLHTGSFVGAHLTSFYEALALRTRHGMLIVYRGDQGQLVGRIGCQKFDSAQALHRVADEFSNTAVERSMIDGFFAMVTAAQRYWTPPVRQEEAGSV